MTPEILIAIGAALLSLLFEFVPGFAPWYDKFDPVQKRLFMAGILFVTVAVLFGLSCAKLLAYFACTAIGAWEAVLLWLGAIAINQGVHLVFKKA